MPNSSVSTSTSWSRNAMAQHGINDVENAVPDDLRRRVMDRRAVDVVGVARWRPQRGEAGGGGRLKRQQKAVGSDGAGRRCAHRRERP